MIWKEHVILGCVNHSFIMNYLLFENKTLGYFESSFGILSFEVVRHSSTLLVLKLAVVIATLLVSLYMGH